MINTLQLQEKYVYFCVWNRRRPEVYFLNYIERVSQYDTFGTELLRRATFTWPLDNGRHILRSSSIITDLGAIENLDNIPTHFPELFI